MVRSAMLDPGEGLAPVRADIHVREGVITEVTAAGRPGGVATPGSGVRVIEGDGLLCLPGFVNAHHHSYDVLAKGLLEDQPFDVWALHSQPAYLGPRRPDELRVRTLVSALDCLRSGITTVQDMCSLVPFDEEALDVILDAYASVGLRVVFSVALRDVAALDIRPFLPEVPEDLLAIVEGSALPADHQLGFVAAQLSRRPAAGRFSWALSPSGPQRCSDALLDGLGALANQHALPLLTHVYETRTQAASARRRYPATGGSMIAQLDRLGLLGERAGLVHAVWITDAELDLVAEAGARIVHNPVSNMKLKSGIAPMVRARRAGVAVALGCDNCSCGDTHNMFQAMKAYCLLAAVSDEAPTGLRARQALEAATTTGAAALGLPGVGAVRAGMAADLVLYDLNDLAYQPLNDVARQVVYAESGRGVHTVIVDGRVLLDAGGCTTIDEAALRAELATILPAFRHDFDANRARVQPLASYLLEGLEQVRRADIAIRPVVEE